MTSSICKVEYKKPSGIKAGDIFAIPFQYKNKFDVQVFIDDYMLSENIDYRFENRGDISFILPCEGVLKILRNTNISENSDKSTIKMVLEEAKMRTDDLQKTLQKQISIQSKNIDIMKNSMKKDFEHTKNMFYQLNEVYRTFYIQYKELSDSIPLKIEDSKNQIITEFKAYVDKSLAEKENILTEKIDAVKDKIFSNSKSIYAVMRGVMDNVSEKVRQAEDTNKETKDLIKTLSETKEENVTHTFVDTNSISQLETDVADIRLLLNSELIIRREEYDRLMYVLKNLTKRVEQIEDYIAGQGGDISDSVLQELRKDYRKNDDYLGRSVLDIIGWIRKYHKSFPV